MREISVAAEAAKIIGHFAKGVDELSFYRRFKGSASGQLLPLGADQSRLVEILKTDGRYPHGASRVDVYNPSVPFEFEGEEYIAGRVESSGKQFEHSTLTVFFRREADRYIPLAKPVFPIQDPNITWIGEDLVLSGVSVFPLGPGQADYRQVFYKGKDLKHLEKFLEGPLKMKGIRLVRQADGKLGVYTRPQGKKGGLGQIGYTEVDSLDKLTEKAIDDAGLLSTRFPNGEWGGVNQVIGLPDGRHLCIGHRAFWGGDERPSVWRVFNRKRERHYFPWAFIHDPKTGEVADLGILGERANFPPCPAKDYDLADVLYTAGIVDSDKPGKVKLIVGISDTQAGVMEINDPRLKV